MKTYELEIMFTLLLADLFGGMREIKPIGFNLIEYEKNKDINIDYRYALAGYTHNPMVILKTAAA